jgi:hypothetical protein
MPTDPLRAKTLACLREGRVSVKRVVSDRDTLAVLEVMAVVASSRERVAPHIVDLRQGEWTCTCPTWSALESGGYCAHLAAVQLVTAGATS